ncbi:U4/U6 small nuclear ribonucleoprotein prp4 [Diatrype stigma]|uniref:U4/U6 small nuclear ribonucleoprotein prp4 n=1 Tax=Diatrype stigma TaxID=117547 RepID=A0AAN9UPT6_9PEZI
MASPGSSDEGEIVEQGVGETKATSLPQPNGAVVDRMDRPRARYSRSRSPEYEHGSRHYYGSSRRSRSPHGLKRPRDRDRNNNNRERERERDRDRDREHNRNGRVDADPRQFRVHYENSRDSHRRPQLSYDDEDRPPSRASASALSYDDRDRDYSRNQPRDRSRDQDRDRNDYPNKRSRKRNMSPYRPPRGARDRTNGFRRGDDRNRRLADRSRAGSVASSNGKSPRHVQDQATHRKESATGTTGGDKTKANSTKKQSTDATPNPQAHAPEPEYEEKPIDVDAEIERRRRRREELLAKSRAATPMLVQALQSSEKAAQASPARTRGNTPMATEDNTPRSSMTPFKKLVPTGVLCSLTHPVASSPSSPAPVLQEGMSPAVLHISSDQELINIHGESRAADDDGPSAADYDPTADMREDELRDELRHGHIGPHGETLPTDQKAEIAPIQEEQQQQQQQPQPKETSGDDDDDDFDMFAEDFDEEKFVAPKPTTTGPIADDRKVPAALAQPNGGGILEGDDKDGYYKLRIGEVLNGRYQVQAALGKGMFSGVARALDMTNSKLVAIKMMRNNDALRKGGFTEIAILQKLNEADLENRKHIVKFERYFEHKGHLCLAFENLSLNLREVLKKFGNNIGINLSAVNEMRNILKICDLGTAIDRSDAATAHTEITPYLVSRFYRAPEIMLGMPYDYAVDMWSIGCTLYEMYTGKILFTGDSNNQMLKAIMEIRGKFSPKLHKRGQLSHMHFDDLGNFVSIERDKVLDKTTVRTLAIVKPTRDLRTRLMAASGGMNDVESRELYHFIDLLERCLALNPDKRITPSEALKHPFFLARAAGPFR